MEIWKFKKNPKGKRPMFFIFGPIIKKAFDISKKLSDKGINRKYTVIR